MKKNEGKNELQKTLNSFVKEGFQADNQRIKKDMCAQFADYRECAREYVVNASDAGATICVVQGTKKGDVITLTISDNGCGMNKEGVKNFFTVYRSNKDHPNSKAVGRHGIGKLSVAAIPNQNRFELHSSTGKETWEAKTGSLLDEQPITVNRLATEPIAGTTFKISFISNNSLKKEMEAYCEILKKYVSFLPMQIQIWIPETDEENSKQIPEFINKEWPGNGISYYKSYHKNILGKEFKIVIGLGNTINTLFQNGVMITSKYNLFVQDKLNSVLIPGLTILVDSPHFELPFGRHCLSNEEILVDLVYSINNNLVPDFYNHVYKLYKTGDLNNYHFSLNKFEVLTSALMHVDVNTHSTWFSVPVFKCINHRVISFRDLYNATVEGKAIYVTDPKLSGIDFSVFDGPVLLNEQIGYCKEVLKTYFEDKMIDLNLESLIIEKPGNLVNDLSETEKEFERNLGFRSELLALRNPNNSKNYPGIGHISDSFDFNEKKSIGKSKSGDIKRANRELEGIHWRVSKLVERDGITPCETHLYLFNKNTIILNLYNSLIKKLVHLTTVNPQLAGHWAMAMCLLDEQNILPHIPAETREDLLMLDAMFRVNKVSFNDSRFDRKNNEFLRDMLRRLSGNDLN